VQKDSASFARKVVEYTMASAN